MKYQEVDGRRNCAHKVVDQPAAQVNSARRWRSHWLLEDDEQQTGDREQT